MKKILVVGSVNVDLVLKIRNFPRPGETIYSAGKKIFLGGKGINQAIALKKLANDVTFIGKIGNDQESNFVLEEANKYQLNLNDIVKIEATTGIAHISVLENGENTIILVPGANHKFDNENYQKWEEKISQYDFLLVQLEVTNSFVFELIKIANKLHKKIILNPAPAKKIPLNILGLCDFIIPNETELSTIFDLDPIANEQEIAIILQKFYQQYPQTTFIVTFGAKGVYYLDQNQNLINIPAKKNIDVVDTTGAGDSFIAAFITQIINNKTIEEAIDFGILASSITITRQGAAVSTPTLEEVKNNV
ncbi:ribokinase [Mycoplasma iguanae]|uniref:Ribokinase n=1 Tax=Mycoplasma iguanae TaxID=292461 RepID=A0ABY5R9A2_9MOLU|nr:ribokinase [Mycoplasma iguanae]UVD81560.1 ribokinase [Mycoplasma iguanae]